MNKDIFSQLINSPKYFPLRFGIVIAMIHLFITLFIVFVIKPNYVNIIFAIYVLLTTPSYLLLLIGNFDFFQSESLMWFFSSLIYGILAGLVVSEEMRGIALILIGLLILSFLFFAMWMTTSL